MPLRIKNTTLTLKLISWFQIIGGITGLGLVASLMLKTGAISGAILFIFTVGIGIFWYSIYSGKRLLTDGIKRNAIVLSIINQTAQIFQWSMFGYGISYCSGVGVTIGIEEVSLSFSGIMSTFEISINNGSDFFIKANLIAILVILILLDIHKELRGVTKEKIRGQEELIERSEAE